MIDYLNTAHYYSEHLIDLEEPEETTDEPTIPLVEVELREEEEDTASPNNYVLMENNISRNGRPS